MKKTSGRRLHHQVDREGHGAKHDKPKGSCKQIGQQRLRRSLNRNIWNGINAE